MIHYSLLISVFLIHSMDMSCASEFGDFHLLEQIILWSRCSSGLLCYLSNDTIGCINFQGRKMVFDGNGWSSYIYRSKNNSECSLIG